MRREDRKVPSGGGLSGRRLLELRSSKDGIARPGQVYYRQDGTHSVAPQHVRCVFRSDSGSLRVDVPPSGTTRWRAVVRVLRSPMDALGCALLPAFCALCGSPLPQLSSVPICDACWTEFPVQSGPLCACCGNTLTAPPDSSATALCRACRLAPPPFVRAVAFGPYQDRMKAAIHALKYDRLHPAARGLGRMLAEAIAQLAQEAPPEMLVVPVPLHRSKYAERGFNQARSLAFYALEFSAQDPSRVAAHAGPEHADATARHREPGRPHVPPAALECARSLLGLRSGCRHHETRSGYRRHLHHRRNGPRCRTSTGWGRSGFRMGGNAGQSCAT